MAEQDHLPWRNLGEVGAAAAAFINPLLTLDAQGQPVAWVLDTGVLEIKWSKEAPTTRGN
ncbi:MAG: hypothetical protein ACKVPX_00225 [Myxococcaceae bacterium]